MQLNMNNIHHQRLRKLLAELVGLHANRLQTQGVEAAQIYKTMTVGMSLVCAEVMRDATAASACCEVQDHMYQQERAFAANTRLRRWTGVDMASGADNTATANTCNCGVILYGTECLTCGKKVRRATA